MTLRDFEKKYTYKEENILGQGGHAKVYLGFDNVRSRRVAIKIAPVPKNNDVSLLAEFNKSKGLGNQHKNICYYEECHRFTIRKKEYDYAVLQYYEEGNLSQLIGKYALTYPQKANLTQGIIAGLHYLHKQGIIHRDLKSSNILIAKDSEGIYVPKIADFGLSTKLQSKKSRSFMGSIGYVSPEAFKMNENDPIYPNYDLWSLGVIVYEIFNGKIPFSVSEESKSFSNQQREYLSQASNSLDDIYEISHPYRDIVLGCLQSDPINRLRSTSQLLTILKGEKTWNELSTELGSLSPPTLDEPKELPESPKKEEKRKNRWLILVLLGLIISSGSLLMSKVLGSVDNTPNENINITAKSDLDGDSGKEEITANLEKNLYTSLSTSPSVSLCQDYLKKYPDGKYAEEVNKILQGLINSKPSREESVYKSLVSSPSISEAENYLLSYPSGRYIAEVRSILNRLNKEKQDREVEYYNNILSSPTISECEDYLRTYNNGIYRSEVQSILDDLKNKVPDLESKDYKFLITSPTVASCEEYLRKYPYGAYKGEVNKLLFELRQDEKWDSVTNSDRKKDYLEYIKMYPNGKYTFEAKAKVDEINDRIDAWLQEEDLEELKDYLILNPNDVRKSELTNIIERLESKEKEVKISDFILELELDMVRIPGATYVLGCQEESCDDDVSNPVEVDIPTFYMSQYEVTQELYDRVMMLKNPSFNKGCRRCPVENVSYYDAQQFIKRLNEQPGNPYRYRLPTEAEWEYAATSDGHDDMYAGGDDIKSVAIYKSNNPGGTSKVGTKKANLFGLKDMSGNVYEWCDSWYNPLGYNFQANTKEKVVRGGSFRTSKKKCRVKERGRYGPEYKDRTIGFRLVRDFK